MSTMSWLSRGEIVALGWTLLHFCWQGTAVAVAYSVIDRMTSRSTSGVRYAVALLALALMPLVVVVTFVEEMRVAAPSHTNTQPAGGNLTPASRGAAGTNLARDPADTDFGGGAAEFLASCAGRARVAMGGRCMDSGDGAAGLACLGRMVAVRTGAATSANPRA
jgi:hypothetical protein